jgi:hypothetical protein
LLVKPNQVLAQESLSGHIIVAEANQESSNSPASEDKDSTPSIGSPILQFPARRPIPSRSTRQPSGTKNKPAGHNFDLGTIKVSMPDFFAESSSNRSGVRQQQVGLMAIVNYVGPGLGIEYIHQLSGWLDLGTQALMTGGKLTDSSNPDLNEFFSTQVLQVKGLARIYYNRHLFLGTGLSFDQIAGNYGWNGSKVVGEELSTNFNAQLLAWHIYLGSEWQLANGFYIGVDWLGLGLPLTSQVTTEDAGSLDDLTQTLTGSTLHERLDGELKKQLIPYYLFFHLGYAF